MSSTTPSKCPFCDLSQSYRDILVGSHIRVIYPKNPNCMYHTLIVPKRHVERFDELSGEEVNELHDLVKTVHNTLSEELGEQYMGYNLLSNNGGSRVNQHVMHSHMHMFSRTIHDLEDPVKSHNKDKIYDLTDAELSNMQRMKDWLVVS